MSDYIMAVTTTADEEGAVAIAKTLVERRIVACVNILPKVRSIYRWQGKVEDGPESVLLMKTRAERYPELVAAIDDLHPYDVPELIVIPIERGSEAYLGWVDENVTGEDSE